MHTAKQHGGLQWWPAAIVGLSRRMPRDEQLVCAPLAQHVESDQHRRHHNRMHAIHADGLDRMQTLNWPAVFLSKGDVATNVARRAT
jgi:hypothetical protein